MDDNSLSIQFEALAQTQTDLGAAYTAAHSTIEELTAKLDQNLANWSGEAKQAYEDAKLEWNRAFAHMAQVLQHAHAHVGSAHELYTSVERQNASIWR